MIKNTGVINDYACRVSKYREISGFVWDFFKKYLPTGADLTRLTDDIHVFTEKYGDTEDRDFMQRLLKVYFDELVKIKQSEGQII